MEFLQLEKRKFLEREVMMSVFQASLSMGLRYRVYTQNVPVEEKTAFKEDVARKIREQSEKYKSETNIGSEKHLASLRELQKYISEKWGGVLYKHGKQKGWITFGRTQKLFNLYLKYCWILNWTTTEPPHCPIDSIVLKKVGWNGYSWQDPRFDEESYKKAIEMCGIKGEKQSIPVWELCMFNDSRKEDGGGKRKCLCDDPLCAKCLGVNCQDDGCKVHTKEKKGHCRARIAQNKPWSVN